VGFSRSSFLTFGPGVDAFQIVTNISFATEVQHSHVQATAYRRHLHAGPSAQPGVTLSIIGPMTRPSRPHRRLPSRASARYSPASVTTLFCAGSSDFLSLRIPVQLATRNVPHLRQQPA